MTKESYLPGVLALAYSLTIHNTAYPLLVLVTSSLSASCLSALKSEACHNSIIEIRLVEPLEPSEQETCTEVPRFKDTWTKLRVFELVSYDTVVYLDADTLIFQNPDTVFDTILPTPDWLAAIHDCTCTLRDNKTGCPYTSMSQSDPLSNLIPVPQSSTSDRKARDTAINSGVFLFKPSLTLSENILHAFNTSTILSTYKAPDQDFLADFFRNRWTPLPWHFNALKPLRYWHGNVWRDDEVVVLHYVMDKPWAKRVASDGIAGLKGRDGWAHGQWWEVWEQWRGVRAYDDELLRLTDSLVAGVLSVVDDQRQVLHHQEQGFPIQVPE